MQRMPRTAQPYNRNHSTVRKVVTPLPAAPAAAAAAPALASVPIVQAPTFGQSIKDGFGLGLGSSLANRLVSNIFGPPQIAVAGAAAQAPTKPELTAYEQCIVEHREDHAVCGHLLQKK